MKLKNMLNDLIQLAHNVRILYVEDEALIRENTMGVLSVIFTHLDEASDGQEAWELYQKQPYDIVITDILMPRMNGLEMIKRIKKMNPEQSIIVTSACDESTYLMELINQGIAQFIMKPIIIDQLNEVLLQALNNIDNKRKAQELCVYLANQVEDQSTILEQYKDIVDIASIVSKTDPTGKITYANEKFCEISGYSQEELIGKPHRIVRHPDIPGAVFENLWSTILDKKVWHGIIKNRKKDGGYYITDTTIKPILDRYGNITEFMSIRFDVTMLFDLHEEIWNTQHELLYLLGEVGETRSRETGFHVKRVALYSKLLGQLYGLSEEEANLLYTASPMHDIGKIGIPDMILLKPGRLTEEEFTEIKKHAEIGFDILKNSERPILKAAAIIAHQHHERWDGGGYPQGLSTEEIHIYGRITALTDVFDALSGPRLYKESWPIEDVTRYLENERGKHFDPELVDIFLENIDRFVAIYTEFSS